MSVLFLTSQQSLSSTIDWLKSKKKLVCLCLVFCMLASFFIVPIFWAMQRSDCFQWCFFFYMASANCLSSKSCFGCDDKNMLSNSHYTNKVQKNGPSCSERRLGVEVKQINRFKNRNFAVYCIIGLKWVNLALLESL